MIGQGHREFPFGNSQELLCTEFPEAIPGNFWNSGGNYGQFIGVLFYIFSMVDYDILQCLI